MGDDGSNHFDGEELTEFLHEIDEADDQLASLKGAYMRDCQQPRTRIKECLGRVKESGVNLVAFKEILAAHRNDRRLRSRIAELDLADKADFEAMREALGPLFDTPLGEAAVAAGADGDGSKGRGGEVLDGLA